MSEGNIFESSQPRPIKVGSAKEVSEDLQAILREEEEKYEPLRTGGFPWKKNGNEEEKPVKPKV